MIKAIDRILDRFVSHLSVEDGPDRTIFYPWGIFGKGVVATTDTQRRNLSRVIKATFVAILPIVMLPPYLSWPAIAAIMAALLLINRLVIIWLARGLETKPSIISSAERTQGFSARRAFRFWRSCSLSPSYSCSLALLLFIPETRRQVC